jgi:hypothetical protein
MDLSDRAGHFIAVEDHAAEVWVKAYQIRLNNFKNSVSI